MTTKTTVDKLEELLAAYFDRGIANNPTVPDFRTEAETWVAANVGKSDATVYYAAYSNRSGKNVHATTDHAESSLTKCMAVCGKEVHNRRQPQRFDSPEITDRRCGMCALIAGFDLPADDRPEAGVRIQRAFNKLPALMGHHLPGADDIELEDVADHLDALVVWFEGYREHINENECKLARYTGAIVGLGKFLDVLEEVRG